MAGLQDINPNIAQILALLAAQQKPMTQPLSNAAPVIGGMNGAVGGAGGMAPSLQGPQQPMMQGGGNNNSSLLPLIQALSKGNGQQSSGGKGGSGLGGLGSLFGKGGGEAASLAPSLAGSASAVGDYGSLLAGIGAAADI